MWNHELKIKDLLTDEDVSPTQATALGLVVARRLRRSPLSNRRYLAECFEDVQDQNDFNERMDDLYDDADAERVWIK